MSGACTFHVPRLSVATHPARSTRSARSTHSARRARFTLHVAALLLISARPTSRTPKCDVHICTFHIEHFAHVAAWLAEVQTTLNKPQDWVAPLAPLAPHTQITYT